MKWSICLINVLIAIGICLTIVFTAKHLSKPIPVVTKEIIEDSLIRDTLYHIKDSLTTKIITIEKSYSEKKANIIANDTTADMRFFTEYINNYTRTVKDN